MSIKSTVKATIDDHGSAIEGQVFSKDPFRKLQGELVQAQLLAPALEEVHHGAQHAPGHPAVFGALVLEDDEQTIEFERSTTTLTTKQREHDRGDRVTLDEFRSAVERAEEGCLLLLDPAPLTLVAERGTSSGGKRMRISRNWPLGRLVASNVIVRSSSPTLTGTRKALVACVMPPASPSATLA